MIKGNQYRCDWSDLVVEAELEETIQQKKEYEMTIVQLQADCMQGFG